MSWGPRRADRPIARPRSDRTQVRPLVADFGLLEQVETEVRRAFEAKRALPLPSTWAWRRAVEWERGRSGGLAISLKDGRRSPSDSSVVSETLSHSDTRITHDTYQTSWMTWRRMQRRRSPGSSPTTPPSDAYALSPTKATWHHAASRGWRHPEACSADEDECTA